MTAFSRATRSWISFAFLTSRPRFALRPRRVAPSPRRPGLETSVYLPGREWKRSGNAVDSFDTDSDEDNVDDDASATSNSSESSEAKAEATSSAG